MTESTVLDSLPQDERADEGQSYDMDSGIAFEEIQNDEAVKELKAKNLRKKILKGRTPRGGSGR